MILVFDEYDDMLKMFLLVSNKFVTNFSYWKCVFGLLVVSKLEIDSVFLLKLLVEFCWIFGSVFYGNIGCVCWKLGFVSKIRICGGLFGGKLIDFYAQMVSFCCKFLFAGNVENM